MKRKLVATAIAVIVSIPLIPVIEKGVEHLTGSDAPMVFPAQGWTLAHELMHQRGPGSIVSANHYVVMVDQTGSMDGWRKDKPPDLTAELNLLPTLTGTALASGLHIGVNTSGGITNWLSREPLSPGDLKTVCRAAQQWCAMFTTDGEVLSTLPRPGIDLSMYQTLIVEMSGDPGGANQTTSWVPSITSLSPLSATAGGAAVTLTASGSGFLAGTTVQWNGSAVPTGFVSATQLTVSIPASLTVAAGSASAAVFSPINGSPPSLATGYVNPKYLVMGVTYAPPGGSASSVAYEDTDLVATWVGAHPQRVNKTGWYALEVGEDSAEGRQLDLEFLPDNAAEPKAFTLRDSGNGGQQAAWIHFKEPGSVIIRTRGSERPALRGMDYAEFMARSRDSTLQRGVLTVTLLDDVLPLMAYILVVCLIRFVAYWLIGKLPRAVRTRATEEVDLMLAFAKWAGVACYAIWTARDILSGVGIVLAK